MKHFITKHSCHRGIALAAICCAPMIAQAAGGHYVVDDAELVGAGQCELEVWFSRFDSNTDALMIMPACNPGGNLELGLGVGRADPGGETFVELAAKTLVQPVGETGWGWGIAGAAHFSDGLSELEAIEAYIPVTRELNDQLLMHVNVGVAHERNGDDLAIWGLGFDYSVLNGVNLIAETYGSHQGGTELQTGLRFGVGEGHVDVSYGQTVSNSDDNWATVGFAWMF